MDEREIRRIFRGVLEEDEITRRMRSRHLQRSTGLLKELKTTDSIRLKLSKLFLAECYRISIEAVIVILVGCDLKVIDWICLNLHSLEVK